MSVNTLQNVSYGQSQPLVNVFNAPIVAKRNPTGNDKAPIGSTWINQSQGTSFILISISANKALWTPTGAVGFSVIAPSPTASVALNANAGLVEFTGFTFAAGAKQVFNISNTFVTPNKLLLVSVNSDGADSVGIFSTNIAVGAFSVDVINNNSAAAISTNIRVNFWSPYQ